MDVEVFKRRFLPFHPKLYRVAYALVGDRADAEDLLQEAYARLWDRRDELEDVRNPEAFAVTLLRNLCLDFLRSAEVSRRQGRESLEEVSLEAASSPERELEARAELQARVEGGGAPIGQVGLERDHGPLFVAKRGALRVELAYGANRYQHSD